MKVAMANSRRNTPIVAGSSSSPLRLANSIITTAAAAAARCHSITSRRPRSTPLGIVPGSCCPTVGVSRSVTVESTIVTPSRRILASP
jgi:hypothetical protein